MSSLDKFKDDLRQGDNPELLKKVSNQNKLLKQRFDEEVLTKQNLQTNLKEIYKPITDTQQVTTGKQTAKTDVLFQQLTADLQGKHDRSSRLLADIIRGLAKSNEETRKQGLDIVSAIAKQPLLPELINELNNYPALVKKIMQPDDIRNLNEQDRKALEPLSHLNDNDLKTLVNYYVLQGKVKSSSEEEELGAIGPPTYAESVFEEHPSHSHAYNKVVTSLHNRKPGLQNIGKGKGVIPTVSPTFYYQVNDRDTVQFGDYNVLFKGEQIKINDKEYVLTPGLEILLNRLNPTLDERITDSDLNNYLNITLDAGFDYRQHRYVGKKLYNVLKKVNKLDDLQKDVQVMGNGLNTVILPDNVDELKKRLTLLLAEYSAGNKSLYNEINAVLDILHKKREIKKAYMRNVLRSLK